MEAVRIQSNQTETVYFLLLDTSGNPVTGLTGAQLNMLTLMRKSDGKYWDGAAWQINKTGLAVAEQDAANSPGLYSYTTPSLAEGEYVVTADTADAANVPQAGCVKAGEYVDNLDASLSGVNAIVTDTRRIVKNKLTIDTVNSKLQLWNDAGTAVLYEWPLTDKDANSISLAAGVPVNRGLPV